MITTSRLANGAHLITRVVPGACSAALGIWLVNGVRHQTPATDGYAHLLEHLLFKGAGRLDARSLARRLERLGGRSNAQTGRELTALYGQVPGPELPVLLELFIHMLLKPRFTDADLRTERRVIAQERAAATPEEAQLEQALARAWAGHPLGWPMLGDREVIAGATAASVENYLGEVLQGSRLWVVAVGAVAHASLEAACRELGRLPVGNLPASVPPVFRPGQSTMRTGSDQAYLLWLLPVLAPSHPDYPALLVADRLLGGGVSSRLFRTVRERLGLAYVVHSCLEFYSDTGLWIIRAVCDALQAERCRRAVEEAIQELIDAGPGWEEREDTCGYLNASLMLEEDSLQQGMERLARESLYLGRHPEPAEYRTWVEAVSDAHVQGVLKAAWVRASYTLWTL